MNPIDCGLAFEACKLTTDPTRVLELKAACKIMVTNQLIYWGIEKTVGIPWFVVAAIHYRESSQNFKCHLHNGDPLTAKTVHVPADRPEHGESPFTWTESAIDALEDRAHPFQWDIGGALSFCEAYNGLGYQKHGVMSPYVWSFTDRYKSGLFIADGTLDLERKDSRPGVASLLKMLIQLGVHLELENGIDSQGFIVH